MAWSFPRDTYRQGATALRAGNYKLAIDWFTKAISENPRDREAYADRGAAYMELKQYRRATKDFLWASRLGENDIDCLGRLAWAYHKQGDDENARKYYRQVTGMYARNASDLCLRGMAFDFLGQYPRAVADFTNATRLEPDFANAYQLRGETRKKMGDAGAADRDFARARQLGYGQ